MQKPVIGEIWVVAIPIIYYDKNEDINVKIQRRPVLILDDGRGLIVEEDRRNYNKKHFNCSYFVYVFIYALFC